MTDPSSLLVGVGPGAIAALPPGADPEIFDHGDGVEQSTGLWHIANQGRALTVKSLLVLRRRKKSTAAYVLMPSLALLALWGAIAGVSAWLDPSTSAAHKNYPLVPLRVRKCEVFDGNNLATGASCTTAMFAPDSPNTVAIMQKFAAATGLVYGTDVVAASSAQAIAETIAQYPGSVDAAVVFTESGSTAGDSSLWAPVPSAVQWDGSGAPALEYQLWTNTTGNMGRWLTGDERHLLDQAGVYGHYEAVLQAVDAAIIGHVSGLDAAADIQVAVGKFAELASSEGTSSPHLRALISWMFGDLSLVLGTSFTALMVLYTISSEKEAKMLAALRTVGLREWLFWTSWALAYFILGIFGAALSTTVGSMLNLRMFVQCSWFVQCLATLFFMQSFAAQAIFLASFVTRGRYIITSSVIVLVVVFGVCTTWKEFAIAGVHYRYGSDSDWMSWTLASIQPWFHYMRIELAILATIYPTGTIDSRWTPVKSVEYSTGTSLWAMVSSPDEGSHEGCCFCFSPNYWGVRRQQTLVMDDDDRIGLEKSRSMLDRSVRTYKLSKAYKEEMAVSEVTMEIESSCCLALLGTNGAGKSTFINILTGIHSPTHGEAFIFGVDVKVDMAKLQKIMGCCPQEDLLWAELTAREHLHLYARFKGIADDVLQQHCTDILTSVGLVADADNMVSTYSGGMKRRLSVGIASVASPTIMFLDEPSTGMDPLSKRRVWTMIEQLKKNRVMLLTTHSMEEADALGDKVAILDKGRLRAIGSSLFLKRTYGKGHTVSLLSEVDDVPRVEQLVKSCVPSAEILGTAAGNTSVSIKHSAVQGIPQLFNSLMGEDGLIKEWSLSDTTLEEVFLRLAAQNREVNAEIEGQDQDEVGRVMLVRSSPAHSAANPELVAVLEASDPSSIKVVGPEGSGLEIVPDTGRADAKRYVCVAQGGAVMQAGVHAETDECGRISQFDEIVALDEVCLPTGVRRVHCDKGWVSTTGTDGADVLKEVTDDTVLAMDKLVIPDASPKSLPMVQMIDMTVPADSQGQSVRIKIAGKTVTVDIPTDAVPGARIQVPVPLPQLQEGVTSSMFSDFGSVKTAGIVQQTFAVVWKNAVLAFGCRKGPGCRGLLNCKCCELFCYVSLFIVMATVALAHIWIVTMIGGMQRDMLNADHAYFCEDGVVHATWETGSGWAPATAYERGAYASGSYCAYQHDGECDEPNNCPVGSDTADCPAVESELNALQFSSCDRAAVAEEMLNLSNRAQVPLPLNWSVGELDLLRQREHQTWTSACNDNDRSRAGGACWADLVAVNSRSLFRLPNSQYNGWGSCSLLSAASDPTCASNRSTRSDVSLFGADIQSALLDRSSLNSSCMPGADIWYSAPQRFSELSLLPDNGMSWAQQSPGYLTMLGLSDLDNHATITQQVLQQSFSSVSEGISMRFREVEPGSVNERVLAAQAYNRDHRAQSAECSTTGSACAGHVHTDHGGGWFSSHGYADNADCQWLLTCPSAASVVELTFTSFSTESGFDFVRVYDDANQMHMLLQLDGEYGDGLSPVTSSGPIMLVRLTSDGSVSRAGFFAEFQCSEPGSPTENSTVQYTGYSGAPTTFHQVQFSSAEEADAWFRDSFPAFALEVDQFLIAGSSITFRYGVRQWTAHAYQSYPFLTTASSVCGQDSCQLDRDVEMVNPYSDTCTDDCPKETKADMTLRGVISAVSNTVLRTRLGMRNASLTATIVPMPEFKYWQANRRPEESLLLWLFMYPLLTMLLIPTLASMLASEKEKGLMDMVKMEGGRTISFFLGNWLFAFAYSLVFNVLFVLTIVFSGAADADSGVQMPGYRVAALLLLWAHAQTGFVHFIGLCMFRKARHAALFGAFAVIIAVMAGVIVTLMEAEHMITSDFFPLSCLLIPPLAYTRTVGVLLWYGGGEEFDRGLTMLMVDGLLYFLLAVGYFLWPTEDVRQLLARLVRIAKARVFSGTTALELPLVNVVSTGGGTPFQSEDESVIAERYRTSTGVSAGPVAIRVEGLVKDYSAVSGGKEVTKRAINELFLSIERNEIFGLLGPNGAGKTSLIQILTGMTPPTAGSATVCGFDINTHMDCVKRVIGVCPQFDVLWEDMTVRQHLVFYSMLRGLPRSRIHVEARRLAEKMELDGDAFNKLASTLSGGAKRRLSIAIALAGRPPCLFFDEPTTGLDPETRRQIWGIIKAEQRDNAIVITTHSMEEADALCTRIGIMAGGSLRAIGSQNDLKSRFGDGFKVTLNCVDENKRRLRRVNDFIMSLSGNAQFVSRFGAHLTYTVPLASGDVALIFNNMEHSKRELGVVEWGVTQASLEEVFIKVVLQWEEGVYGQSFRNAFANPLNGVGGGIASSSDEED